MNEHYESLVEMIGAPAGADAYTWLASAIFETPYETAMQNKGDYVVAYQRALIKMTVLGHIFHGVRVEKIADAAKATPELIQIVIDKMTAKFPALRPTPSVY